VTTLKVAHLIVLGHSNCGGVQGCYDMCSGNAPELNEATSFTGRWMDILRPGYERIKDITDPGQRIRALEQEAVLISLENMLSFPFITKAIASGHLTLHGLWHDIGEGGLEQYNAETGKFAPI
jgi:carbonic anhydrase